MSVQGKTYTYYDQRLLDIDASAYGGTLTVPSLNFFNNPTGDDLICNLQTPGRTTGKFDVYDVRLDMWLTRLSIRPVAAAGQVIPIPYAAQFDALAFPEAGVISTKLIEGLYKSSIITALLNQTVMQKFPATMAATPQTYDITGAATGYGSGYPSPIRFQIPMSMNFGYQLLLNPVYMAGLLQELAQGMADTNFLGAAPGASPGRLAYTEVGIAAGLVLRLSITGEEWMPLPQ